MPENLPGTANETRKSASEDRCRGVPLPYSLRNRHGLKQLEPIFYSVT